MTIEDRISQETGISSETILLIARSASHRYKTYTIAKRTGGVRLIAHPAVELKFLQRWLVDNVLSSLPIHPSALGYRTNISIKDVARCHVDNRFLLIMDLLNFFESIRREDVCRLLERHSDFLRVGLDERDRNVVGSLLTRYDRLPIGAPSSPATSNAFLFEFDREISNYCTSEGISYSRYADDLHFSTSKENVLGRTSSRVRELLAECAGNNLRVNDEKIVFTSKKRRRLVVGLYLTSNNQVSIGRPRKRHIKGMLWRYKTGRLNPLEASMLRGLLAFIHSVEPDFLTRLRSKYGAEIIAAAATERLLRRK